MIKLIATDLDNTLLDKSGRVPRETALLIKRVGSMGITVTLATGRSFPSVKGVADEIASLSSSEGDHAAGGLAICYNGSQVRRIEDGEILFSEAVNKALTGRFMKLARDRKLYLQLYCNDEIIVEKLDTSIHPDPDLAYASYREVGSFSNMEPIDSPKILIATDPSEVPALQSEIEEMFEGEIFCAQSDSHLIEIVPKGVNKGAALIKIRELMGITKAETMAFGDNTNDIHLLKEAGIAVAVANAVPALKEAADYVTKNERSDGFIEAIEKFVLKM